MTTDYSYYSRIYCGNNTKNIIEDRNCLQLEPKFLFNPSSYDPITETYYSYYVQEFVAVNDYTYFVLCSDGYYSNADTIYIVTNGVRELYYDLKPIASDVDHRIMHVGGNQNIYLSSYNKDDMASIDFGIYKISKDKVRSLAIKINGITDISNIIDYVVSNKSGCIYILYKIYSEDDGYRYYFDKYNLTDYSLIKSIPLNGKKPDTYDSAYYFKPVRLFLKADGTPYIYGQKLNLE